MDRLRIGALCAGTAAAAALLAWVVAPEERRHLPYLQKLEYFENENEEHEGEARQRQRSAIAAGAFQQAQAFPTDGSLGEWRKVGPFNYGGKVYSVAVDPRRPGTVWAAYHLGGLWKTEDSGASWKQVGTREGGRLIDPAIDSVSISPVDGRVYAALNDLDHNKTQQGVLRSSDGGETWTAIGVTLNNTIQPANQPVSVVAAHPTQANTVFAGSSDGLYRTTDGGTSWVRVLSWGAANVKAIDIGDYPDIQFKPGDPSVMLVAQQAIGVMRSIDGGRTWERRVDTEFTPNSRATVLAWSSSNPNIVYAERPANAPGVDYKYFEQPMATYKSTDAGNTWTATAVIKMAHQGRYDMAMAVDPANSSRVLLGNTYLHESKDGLATAQDAHEKDPNAKDAPPNRAPHPDHLALVFDPGNPSVVYSGNDGGVWVSRDGGKNWDRFDEGVETSHTTFLDLEASSGRIYATSHDYGVGLTLFPGRRATDLKLGYEYFPIYTGPSTFVFGHGIFSDFGRLDLATGELTQPGVTKVPFHYKFGFGKSPQNANVVYYGGATVWKSSDQGATFQDLRLPQGTGNVRQIVESAANPSVVFAITAGAVFRSSNGGATWTRNATPGGFNNGLTLAASADGTTLLAGDDRGLWKSSDGGANFAFVSSGPPSSTVHDIAWPAADRLFVGTELGVYVSRDQGVTWARLGPEMPIMPVYTLRVDGGNALYAGTLQSIWQMSLNGPRGCSAAVWLDPAPIRFTETGGDRAVHVSAPESCSWPAITVPSWLTVSTYAKVNGNGLFRLTASRNTGVLREGVVRVAGQDFAVTQFAASTSIEADGAPLVISDAKGACLTDGATLSMAPCTNGSNQRFTTKQIRPGVFRLGSGSSAGGCLDNYWYNEILAKVWRQCHGDWPQQYEFLQVGDRSWMIHQVSNPYPVECLSVKADNAVEMKACDGSQPRIFTIRRADATIIESNPAGLQVVVDGKSYSTPQTFLWSAGTEHTISAGALEAGPGTRYGFVSWSDGGAASRTVKAADVGAVYTANFVTQYRLTTSSAPDGAASVASTPARNDGGWYDSGTEVSLRATPAEPALRFKNWSGDLSGEENPKPLVMNGPKSVRANLILPVTLQSNPAGLRILVDGLERTTPAVMEWLPGQTHTIAANQQGIGATSEDLARYVFRGWADNAQAPSSRPILVTTGQTAYTASFQAQYKLDLRSVPAEGIVRQNSELGGARFYDAGTVVRLEAGGPAPLQWVGWSGDRLDAGSTTSSGVGTITMTGAKVVTAFFGRPVTIQSNPAGREVLVDGQPRVTPYSTVWSAAEPHTLGVNAEQAIPGGRYLFASWSDNGPRAREFAAGTAHADAFTATFNTEYQLTTGVSPTGFGEIEATPASADGYYRSGTAVRLFAAANNRRQFVAWQGDAAAQSNPATVLMDRPRSVTATYNLSVTVSTAPQGRDFIVDDQRYTGIATFSWPAGSQHRLSLPTFAFFSTTQPGGAGTRHVFRAWSDGGAATHTITAAAGNEEYVAAFTTQHLLTAIATPEGMGRISVEPTSADGYYNAGTSIRLAAEPVEPNPFRGWSGDLTGTAAAQTLRMDAPRQVIAAFGAAPPPVSGIISPVPSSLLSGSTVTFRWLGVPGAENYRLSLGTARGGGDIADGLTTAESQTIQNVPCNGQTVWVRLATRVGGVWQEARDYTYTAAASCTTP